MEEIRFFLLLQVIVLPDEPSADTEGVSELTQQKIRKKQETDHGPIITATVFCEGMLL